MTIPSLKRSLLIGGLGFGLASLCVFATVAFAERWMYTQLGLYGAYLVWTAFFILLGGGVLGSLVVGRWRLPKFYLLFGIAFFAYAVGWTAAYFVLRGAPGEWIGSLVGSLLMGSVFAGLRSSAFRVDSVRDIVRRKLDRILPRLRAQRCCRRTVGNAAVGHCLRCVSGSRTRNGSPPCSNQTNHCLGC